MNTGIHRLPLGMCNCFVIRQEGTVLVDAGPPNQADRLRRLLAGLSIEPRDIRLVLLTHGHWDHIGSVAAVRDLTGVRVAINHREKDWVEQALKPLPPGNGIFGGLWAVLMKVMVRGVSFPPAPVDLVLGDEDFPLGSLGIKGTILHTPGHSAGSMSLLLDNGAAFVGDLAMNGLPLRIGPGMPPLADDASVVKASWRLLLERGASTIYPAHGKPFDAKVLERAL